MGLLECHSDCSYVIADAHLRTPWGQIGSKRTWGNPGSFITCRFLFGENTVA